MTDYITAQERLQGFPKGTPWWGTAIMFAIVMVEIYYCLWTIGGY